MLRTASKSHFRTPVVINPTVPLVEIGTQRALHASIPVCTRYLADRSVPLVRNASHRSEPLRDAHDSWFRF